MTRERGVKIALVLGGLLFLAGAYPLMTSLWHADASVSEGDKMMLSLYVTLGVFVLLAARNPSANRSLIAFTAWSSFAHGAVMAAGGLHIFRARRAILLSAWAASSCGVRPQSRSPGRRAAD